MSRTMRHAIRAFTLVEIMIVVLVIGILLAIAIPNFNKARENSQTKACIANLKQIATAKEQWAIEKRQDENAEPSADALKDYIKSLPVCPAGGDKTFADCYTINAIKTNPQCKINGTDHVLP